jgi:hypothetical protein
MKNFKDFITEKMRKDPKQEEARLLSRLERIRSEIPTITPDESKILYSQDPSVKKSAEARKISGKLFKQASKSAQFRDVEASLQGVEDISRGAIGKQTSALSRGFGTQSQIRAYKTSTGKYTK